ncbi:MAG: M64 family metallopeptidase, partial [Solirubrobacteraceae bacterium]
ADEYESDGTPNTPAGAIVTSPNIATATTRAALAVEPVTEHQVWASFIKATTPTPSTAPKTTQSPAPNDLSSEPLANGVTVQDVGLFEGGNQHQLGSFRPFADCRMRHLTAPFCPVCEHTIRARLGAWELPAEKPTSSFATGSVTHVFTVPLVQLAFGTYDMTSGAVHLFDGFGASFGGLSPPKDLIVPGAALPPGCTSVLPFDGPGGPFVYTHSFATGARQVHRFVQTAAGVDIQPVFDTGPAFDAPWTSVSLPLVEGRFHVLGYNRFTGEAALTPLDLINPTQPDRVSWRDPSRVWQAGWPHVEAFNLREKVLLLRASDFGPRDLHSLLPLGPRPSDFVIGDPTEPDGSTHHLTYQIAGSLRLVRYSGISGRLALEALRPDGSAFDFIGARRFAPGGLSILGQEAPVFAVGLVLQQSPVTLLQVLAWHHAPTQTLRLHVMGAVSRS